MTAIITNPFLHIKEMYVEYLEKYLNSSTQLILLK